MRPALVTMVFLGGLQFAVSNAQIKFDPRIRWNTFETRHCVVHYPQGEDSLAQVVAQKAERYLQRLSGIFHEAPHDKVEIVLDTSSDIVFGAATPIPHLAVFLNPTPTHLGLGHFDDWLDLIIAHELTHAVDLDKLGGLPSAIRSLIGRLYFPGALGPQWLTEGIATHFETELTGAGRGLDPFHDMILRMAFLEDRVTAADQNTTFLSRWPGGNSAYVYGMSFYRYLARHYGQEAIIKLRERYANNLIPFRASEAVSAATSKGLKPAYRDWQEEMRHRYEQQAEAIRQTGLTPSRQLTHLGYDNWSPEWSADGKTLYFVSNDANKHQEIRAVNLATGEQKKIKAVNLFETL